MQQASAGPSNVGLRAFMTWLGDVQGSCRPATKSGQSQCAHCMLSMHALQRPYRGFEELPSY